MELLINTAQREIHIGLVEDKEIIASNTWEANRMLAEELMIRIQDLLESCKKTISDVRSVCVHRGPGDGQTGFTTLRIGVVAANTLAYALDIPLYAVEGSELSLSELASASRVPVQSAAPSYSGPPNIG